MAATLQRLALAPCVARRAPQPAARVAASAAPRPLRRATPLRSAHQPCALLTPRGAASPLRRCAAPLPGAQPTHALSAPQRGVAQPRRGLRAPRASRDDEPSAPSSGVVDSGSNVLFGLLWVSLVAYAALYAPDQTPARDAYFLEKLLNLGVDDGVALNPIWFSLFNIMGVWPAVYAALLTPAGRSANGVPAWPFVTGSFALGAFALLPFFALWAPPAEADVPTLPAVATGPARALESRITAAVLLVATLGLAGKALTAGGAAWEDFGHLFLESKFVHVTTVDFITLTLCAPFWVWNDAAVRRYKGPTLLFALTPLLGPVLWLNVRPRSE